MDMNERQPGETGVNRALDDTVQQADLKRAAHKIAWFRMNGRNDASNPFSDRQGPEDSRGEGRQ